MDLNEFLKTLTFGLSSNSTKFQPWLLVKPFLESTTSAHEFRVTILNLYKDTFLSHIKSIDNVIEYNVKSIRESTLNNLPDYLVATNLNKFFELPFHRILLNGLFTIEQNSMLSELIHQIFLNPNKENLFLLILYSPLISYIKEITNSEIAHSLAIKYTEVICEHSNNPAKILALFINLFEGSSEWKSTLLEFSSGFFLEGSDLQSQLKTKDWLKVLFHDYSLTALLYLGLTFLFTMDLASMDQNGILFLYKSITTMNYHEFVHLSIVGSNEPGFGTTLMMEVMQECNHIDDLIRLEITKYNTGLVDQPLDVITKTPFSSLQPLETETPHHRFSFFKIITSKILILRYYLSTYPYSIMIVISTFLGCIGYWGVGCAAVFASMSALLCWFFNQ